MSNDLDIAVRAAWEQGMPDETAYQFIRSMGIDCTRAQVTTRFAELDEYVWLKSTENLSPWARYAVLRANTPIRGIRLVTLSLENF